MNKEAFTLVVLKVVTEFGYKPSLQGDFDNIVITSAGPADGGFRLLGAHYDSVPGAPGVDGSPVTVEKKRQAWSQDAAAKDVRASEMSDYIAVCVGEARLALPQAGDRTKSSRPQAPGVYEPLPGGS